VYHHPKTLAYQNQTQSHLTDTSYLTDLLAWKISFRSSSITSKGSTQSRMSQMGTRHSKLFSSLFFFFFFVIPNSCNASKGYTQWRMSLFAFVLFFVFEKRGASTYKGNYVVDKW